MNFRSIFVVAVFSAASTSTTTNAFQPVSLSSTQQTTLPSALQMLGKDSEISSNSKSNSKNKFASWALAGSIFASTLTAGFSAPPAAFADGVELSTGAVIIQTSTKQGQSLLKAEVDVKDLLASLFKNRKALKASVGRVATVVQEELKAPVWSELTKTVLQFENDAAPQLTVLPPRDVQQTLSDISKGKLNLIVNGEIINLSVDKTTSQAQDEIVIRAKGVKGVAMPSFNEPAVFQARTRIQDQLDSVRGFWYAPLGLPESVPLPEGVEINNGAAIVGGGVLAIGGSYGVSYAYYIAEQEAAATKAEAQRALMAERKKKGAAAKAKADAETETEADSKE